MVADFLTPHGFDVSIEERGDVAARIVDEYTDVVVLDVNLSGLDGFSMSKAVRFRYHGAIITPTAK